MLGQASSGVFALGETDEPTPVTPIPVQAHFRVHVAAKARFRIRPIDVETSVWIDREEQEDDA